MKLGPFGPMPWDLVVFLTITSVGFGFSLQKVISPRASSFVTLGDDTSPNAGGVVFNQTLDLGCIERKSNHERITAEEGSIRLRGQLCHLDKKQMRAFDGMRVKNLTTGSEGTIFFKGRESAFVTDYLVLTAGTNLIQVEWKETATSPARTLLTEVYEK